MGDFNYFAEKEQAAQEKFKQQRDSAFSPIVRLLQACGITPNVVSALGMLALAPFVYLVIVHAEDPWKIALSCSFLLLHIALDGLDGPLARRMGKEGPAGAFIDMCCDHGGAVIVVWAVSWAGLIDGTIGNIYVFSYTMAVVFIIWMNALEQPFRFVFRSKYFFYAAIFTLGWIGARTKPCWHYLDWTLLAFSVSNLWICLLGFLRVKKILESKSND